MKSTVLQRTHWQSSTSGTKVRWLDDSRSQSSQWRLWILKQLPTRSRGTRYCHPMDTQWIQSYPCKTKTSHETEKSLSKFLEPSHRPKVVCTDNSMEFGKACEFFIVESPQFNTPSIRDKCHRWKSRLTSIKKVLQQYCSSHDWMKGGGPILWKAIAICEMSETSWVMGRDHMKKDLENHSKGQ